MNQYFYEEGNSYMLEDQFCLQQSRKQSFSLGKSNENMPTYKTKIASEIPKNSMKSKYIQKLKQYTNKDQYQQKYQQNCSIPSLDKRQRNRMAAKQSRDRKKLYIQLMKYQQKNLQNQLANINKQIQSVKDQINRFCSSNKTVLFGLLQTVGFATLTQLQAKLQHLLVNKQTQSSSEQIAIILDSMSYRMGGTGRERIQKQTECYNSIINLTLTPLHRYFIWSAIQETHVFSNKNMVIDQTDEFINKLPIKIDNLKQRQQKLMEIKCNISNCKDALINPISQLLEIKDNFLNVVKVLQTQINLVRDILTPVQAATLLLFSLRNKYRREFNFFPEDKGDSQLKLSMPRKKVKKQ